jgi:8-oxo-dGTP pyrophosphatase MutT (NUDIX family)
MTDAKNRIKKVVISRTINLPRGQFENHGRKDNHHDDNATTTINNQSDQGGYRQATLQPQLVESTIMTSIQATLLQNVALFHQRFRMQGAASYKVHGSDSHSPTHNVSSSFNVSSRRAAVAVILRVRPITPPPPPSSIPPGSHTDLDQNSTHSILTPQQEFQQTVSESSIVANQSPSFGYQWINQQWVQQGELEVLYIKRAQNPRDLWSGHMAFPGGRQDAKADRSHQDTAERETFEEIGINLASEDFCLLGRLDDYVMLPIKMEPLPIGLFVYLQLNPVTPEMTLDPAEVFDTVWTPLKFFADVAAMPWTSVDIMPKYVTETKIGAFLQPYMAHVAVSLDAFIDNDTQTRYVLWGMSFIVTLRIVEMLGFPSSFQHYRRTMFPSFLAYTTYRRIKRTHMYIEDLSAKIRSKL